MKQKNSQKSQPNINGRRKKWVTIKHTLEGL